MMTVKLLNESGAVSGEHFATMAALTCTGNEGKVMDTPREIFLSKMIEKGHLSVLEHIVFTFHIEGISRALLQELARHRHISLSVKSTRYTLSKDLKDFDALCRCATDNIYAALSPYITGSGVDMTPISEYFSLLKGILSRLSDSVAANSDGLPNALLSKRQSDILKYLMPESIPTSLMMTVNARELRHIFALRSQPEALLEFRRLTGALYDALPNTLRYLFNDCINPGVFTMDREYEDDVDDED